MEHPYGCHLRRRSSRYCRRCWHRYRCCYLRIAVDAAGVSVATASPALAIPRLNRALFVALDVAAVMSLPQLYMFVFGWVILLLEARSSILPKRIVGVRISTTLELTSYFSGVFADRAYTSPSCVGPESSLWIGSQVAAWSRLCLSRYVLRRGPEICPRSWGVRKGGNEALTSMLRMRMTKWTWCYIVAANVHHARERAETCTS